MELKDFFKIFVVHKWLFCGIIVFFVVVMSVLYFLQDHAYNVSLILNITRDAPTVEASTDASTNASINEYTYNGFYRLQADERFADTVVRWIQAPYIVKKVFSNITAPDTIFAHYKQFDAKRLSSQVIAVHFVAPTKEDAHATAKELVRTLNEESQKLNAKQKQANWFIILGSQPVITIHEKSFLFWLGIGCASGFFVAFWAVMIVHYIIGSPYKE